MKQEIQFLLDGKILGQAPLPNFSDEDQRIDIAEQLGLKKIDQYKFLTDGEVRFDSKVRNVNVTALEIARFNFRNS